MALVVDFKTAQDLSSGQTLRIYDTTGDYNATTNTGGYGTPNPLIQDCFGQLIFGTYQRQISAQSDLSTVTAYYEYQATTEPVDYDGKQVALNALFIPVHDSGLGASQYVSETGRILISTLFDPINFYVDFDPTDLLYSSGTTIFPDDIYTLQYDVYNGGTAITTGNIVAGQKYIVTGTGAGISYSVGLDGGGFFYENDTFIGLSGHTTFSTYAGSPVVYKRASTVEKFFLLSYQTNWYVQQALALIQTKSDVTQQARMIVGQMEADYQALQNMFYPSAYTPGTVDTLAATNIIANIALNYTRIVNMR